MTWARTAELHRGGLPGAGRGGDPTSAASGSNLLWLRPGRGRRLGGVPRAASSRPGRASTADVRDRRCSCCPASPTAHPELAARFPVVAAPVSRRPAGRCAWSPRARGSPRRTAAPRRRAPRRRHRAAGPRRLPGRPDDPRPAVPGATRSTSRPLKLAWLRAIGARRRRSRAAVVVVPSEYVRGTVVEAFGIRADRVVVVPHGLPSAGRRPSSAVERRSTNAALRRRRYRRARHRSSSTRPSPTPTRTTSCCVRGAGPARRRPRRRAAGAPRRRGSGGGRRCRRRSRSSGSAVGCADRAGSPTATATASTRLADRRWPSRAATRGSALPVLEAMAAGLPGDRRRRDGAARGGRRRRPAGAARRSGGVGRRHRRSSLDDPAEARAAPSPPGRARVAAFTAERSAAAARRTPTVWPLAVKLAVLCPHFAPDVAPTGEVITRIVLELADRGHQLHVVTALPWYVHHRVEPAWAGRTVQREATEWGSIARVHPFPTDKRDIPRRAAGLRRLQRRWPAWPGSRGGHVDGVLAMSPPLTLGLTGWGMAVVRGGPARVQHPRRLPRRRHRARGDHRRPRLIAAARWLERVSYAARRRRDRAVRRPARQRGRQDRRPASGDKVRVIPNFVDTDAIRPRDRDDGLPARARHRRRDRGHVRRQRRLLAVARAAGRRGRARCVADPGGGVRHQRRGLGLPEASSARRAGLPNVRFAPLPAQGAPGRGAGHRRRARRAAQAGPGPRRACRRRPTRSWPPAARSWPASTPAPRWPASSSGPGAGSPCRPTTRRPSWPGSRSCWPVPTAVGPSGSEGRAVRRALGVARGRGRGLRGAVRGASRRGDASVRDPPGSLDPSWVRHRRRRRLPGSRSRARAARSAPVRDRCSHLGRRRWPCSAWRW